MVDNESSSIGNGQDAWRLSAVVGRNPVSPTSYDFRLSGWKVQDVARHTMCAQEFLRPVNPDDVYGAIHDLENILLAMFAADYLPRKIFRFAYSGDLDKESRLDLMEILGDCRDALVSDKQIPIYAFVQSGTVFGTGLRPAEDAGSSVSLIQNWFDFFCQHRDVAASIGLVKESYLIINRLHGHFRYHDYLELGTALILLVSGLESLFARKSLEGESNTETFQRVGSAYYDTFVTEDFLNKFGAEVRQLSSHDIRMVLKMLYRIRSKIAHGSFYGLLTGDRRIEWNTILSILNVTRSESFSRSLWMRHVLLALGLLQKHLTALICCSKKHLVAGINHESDRE